MGDRQRIAVIGAGMGGLSAAAILARHGDVTVFERATDSGGKIRQLPVGLGLGGVDSGPTVFTMDWALESVFERAGARLEDHLTLIPQSLLARHYWPDGTALDLFTDIDRSTDAIGAVFGTRDANAYRQFCAETRRVYETLKTPFMEALKPSFLGLVTRCSPVALLGTAPFSTLWDRLSARFKSPKLRQLFGRYSTYCGASPYSAPATLMLVAHVEQSGVWAVEGGMKSVPETLERVARTNGARFEFGAHVAEIRTAGGRVEGLRVQRAGANAPEDMAFDRVVMNGDVAALTSGAMGPGPAAGMKRPRRAARSQSAMTWSFAGAPSGVLLAFHTVFFSDDYKAEFDAVFTQGAMPNPPTVYVCAPDRAEGLVAPPPTTETPHGERLFALINAPANGDQRGYAPEGTHACQQTMLDQVARCGAQLNPHPGSITATTPQDFAAMFPATGGGLYGMASHGWQASFQRPGVRSPIKGLYLAGGSAHPGPGVPMAALSGRAAAEAMLSDCGLTARFPGAAISGGTSTPLARTAPTG